MNNYIEQAHRTSAPVEPVIDRLATMPQSLVELFYILQGLHVFAAKLDKWKAWAYYGKGEYPTPPNRDEVYATMPVMALESALAAIDSTDFLEILHAVVGIGSEAGETIQALMPVMFEGSPFDRDNAHEEAGDILWYLAKFFRFTSTDFNTVMAANIAKLKKRYPNKFTEEAAQNRDLDAERLALINSGKDGSIMPNGKFVPDENDIVIKNPGEEGRKIGFTEINYVVPKSFAPDEIRLAAQALMRLADDRETKALTGKE